MISLAYKAFESLVTVKLSKSSTSKSFSAFTYVFLHWSNVHLLLKLRHKVKEIWLGITQKPHQHRLSVLVVYVAIDRNIQMVFIKKKLRKPLFIADYWFSQIQSGCRIGAWNIYTWKPYAVMRRVYIQINIFIYGSQLPYVPWLCVAFHCIALYCTCIEGHNPRLAWS